MHRRQFLIGSVGLTAAVAGCSGGDGSGGDDDTDDSNGGGTDWSIAGELRESEGFEAVDLGGNANDDNTLTLGGELRYTGEGSVVVSDLFYNFYDTDGRGLVSANVGLDSEQTVASGETFTYEHETEDLGKTEASTVGSFEAIVSSRSA
jgi:hypothetical protein